MTTLPHPSPAGSARRRVARLLALVAVPALLAAFVAASPANAAVPGGSASTDTVGTAADEAAAPGAEWSVVPADSDGPDGRISLRHVIEPGDTVRDAIAVTNLSGERTRFAVEPGDGITGSGGAFDVALDEPTGSGAWIRIGGLDDDALSLDAGQTTVLPVELSVPADATPGDHPAGIVVGISNDVDGVTVTHRIGVRVHLQVAGEIAAALDVTEMGTSFTPSWLPFAPGTLRVDYTLVNAGNVRLGASANASAAGIGGVLPAAAHDEVDELLPGDTARGSAEMTVWPLFALFGDVTVTATAVGEDAVATPDATVQSLTVVAVSWTGVVLLLLVAGLVVLFVLRRRRRARRETTRIEEAVAEALRERELDRGRDLSGATAS